MTPILVAGPAAEPVSVPEMRAYLRLDEDAGAAEDALVADLIRAARRAVEALCGRVLVDSRWRLVLDRWPPGRAVPLPLSPLIAVERVAVVGADGAGRDLAPALFRAEGGGDPPRVVVDPAAPEPGVPRGGLIVEWRAGYGAAAEVPEPLRHAVRLLAARWYEHRGDGDAGRLPADIGLLVAPFRPVRL